MTEATSLRAELSRISESDWAATPTSVQELLLRLVERMEQQSQQIATLQVENQLLREQVAALQAENASLREQLQRHSGNSSQPPSQDQHKGFKQAQRSAKKPGRKRGGQSGHPGHERPLYDACDCMSVHDHYPECCARCGAPLSGEDPAPYRHQVVELPPILPEVVEHRFHELICPECEARTRASMPEILRQGGYGSRLSGLVVFLSAQAHQSHQQIVQLLDEVFGVAMATGTVARLRQQFSQSIQPVIQAAQAYVQAQATVGMDETGFRQGNSDGQNDKGRRAWLWVMTTPWVSYFAIHLSRSRAVTKSLLGTDYLGIVGSDRYSAYGYLPLDQRQICWAHLKRDFTAIAERAGPSAAIGQMLLDIEAMVFDIWHDLRAGVISYVGLREQLHPLRQQLIAQLREAIRLGEGGKTPLDKTARTCAQILKVEPALWTFTLHPGIEPTNNASERALRPAVLWRKVSLGSQSQAGSEFVAQALTVITSLKAQNRPILDYLTDVFTAARAGLAIPSLLPINDG
jgi:transposase